MIDKIKSYLEQSDIVEFLPLAKEKYTNFLKDFGLNENINSSFIELMGNYAGEFHGKYGFLINVAKDLEDFNTSMTDLLRDDFGLPDKYIAITNEELENYIFYDMMLDEVVLVEYGKINDFIKGNITKKWNSFNEFLEDFFELD